MKARKIQKVARPETLFVSLQAKLEGLAPQGVLLASALTVSPRSVLLSFVALLSLVIWGVWSLAPELSSSIVPLGQWSALSWGVGAVWSVVCAVGFGALLRIWKRNARALGSPRFRRRIELAWQLLARILPFADPEEPAELEVLRIASSFAPQQGTKDPPEPRPVIALRARLVGGEYFEVRVFESAQPAARYHAEFRCEQLTHHPRLQDLILPGPLESAPRWVNQGTKSENFFLATSLLDVVPSWRISDAEPTTQAQEPGVVLAEIISRVLGAAIPALRGEHHGLRHMVSPQSLEVHKALEEAAEPHETARLSRIRMALPRSIYHRAQFSPFQWWLGHPGYLQWLALAFVMLLASIVMPALHHATGLIAATSLGVIVSVLWSHWQQRVQSRLAVRESDVGAPELRLNDGVLCAGSAKEDGIDERRAFSISLSRCSGESGDFLGVELTQKKSAATGWNRLRFRIPVTSQGALQDLPSLASHAVVVDPQDVSMWLWPWLRYAAGSNGQQIRYELVRGHAQDPTKKPVQVEARQTIRSER